MPTVLTIKLVLITVLLNYINADNRGVLFSASPNLRKDWVFHGQLEPQANSVTLNPQMVLLTNDSISKSRRVCGINVHHSDSSQSNQFPFLVVMQPNEISINHVAQAKITLKPPYNERHERLLLNKINQIVFQVEAYDCDQPRHYSERKFVVITIKSPGQLHPKFTLPSYHFMIDMDNLLTSGNPVGKVAAVEMPSSTTQQNGGNVGGICKYELIAPSPTEHILPFAVDSNGKISTTVVNEILSNTENMVHYKFLVRATDCQHPPNRASVLVTVTVHKQLKQICKSQWKGFVEDRLTYLHNYPMLPLLTSALHQKKTHQSPSLLLCSKSCNNMLYTLQARLLGDALDPASAKQCSHDSRVLRFQQMMCGASKQTVNLHPILNTNEDLDNTYFNGARYFQVDQSTIPVHGLSSFKGFTIGFWLKHGDMMNGSPKEHILCDSDSHKLNRHHYSVFLHNCKLILLKRTEPTSTAKSYRPSEFRFGPLNQVCDDQWHYYAVSMYRDEVILQVDGETVESKQLEVLIDKPLHAIGGSTNTILTIGACFNSKNDSYAMPLKGHLAGVNILPQGPESANVIRCLATCGESLQIPNVIQNMDPEAVITILSDSITIKTSNLFSLLRMVSTLSYMDNGKVNKNIPEVTRTVVIDTNIICDNKETLKVKPHIIQLKSKKIVPFNIQTKNNMDSNVKISMPHPLIKVNINQPINLLKGLSMKSESVKHLDSCILRPINNALTKDESLEWISSEIVKKHFSAINNSRGLILEGSRSIEDYVEVLSKFIFYRTKAPLPDYLTGKRILGLVCSIDSAHVTEQYIIQIVIDHSKTGEVDGKMRTYYVVEDPSQNSNSGIAVHGRAQFGHASQSQSLTNRNPSNSSSLLIGLLGSLLCVLVLATVVVVGLVTYRRQRQRQTRTNQVNQSNQFMMNRFGDSHNLNFGKLRIRQNPLDDTPPNCDQVDELDEEFDEEYDEEYENDNQVNNTSKYLPISNSIASPGMNSLIPPSISV